MYPMTAYKSRPPSDQPRDVEAWALAEAAQRLIRSSQEPQDVIQLQAALRLNQRLWTIFQASVTEDDCPLPTELRQNILSLSLVVDRETTARLIDQDANRLSLLIEINRSVSGGLSQRTESDPTAQPASAPAERQPSSDTGPQSGPAGSAFRVSA